MAKILLLEEKVVDAAKEEENKKIQKNIYFGDFKKLFGPL